MLCSSLSSVMAVSSFSALSVKPRGTVTRIKDFSSFPCPRITRSWMLHQLSSPSMKRNNLVLGGRRNGVGVWPSHNRCDWTSTKHTPALCGSLQGFACRAGGRALLWNAPHSRCQVKSEDTEGTLSCESVILDEQTLERDLQAAIKVENYFRAGEIRDILRDIQKDGKASVLAANSRFYNSFRNGDLAAMQSLWAKGENACLVHRGESGIFGYKLVMGSWEYVWANYEFPLDIKIKNVQVHVRGHLGYVNCTEMIKTKGRSRGIQFATNVFERIDGQWFICIHHASNVDF
ncbi:uncharacterized protein LOC130763888 isoform X2 [Actinidia eriantha]|uniref:uncharacterized protein LOC130763888 isoform X2 n=1 Tax=Actinidia eriantha TaxID=165200 RepID=UPI002583138B|nr:uncharacterized protein LOC130763888 isoform X2 [Actinidia eriantha]